MSHPLYFLRRHKLKILHGIVHIYNPAFTSWIPCSKFRVQSALAKAHLTQWDKYKSVLAQHR